MCLQSRRAGGVRAFRARRLFGFARILEPTQDLRRCEGSRPLLYSLSLSLNPMGEGSLTMAIAGHFATPTKEGGDLFLLPPPYLSDAQ